jgi:diguanylate cyclase (GGDEF)-like protein/PAS domain S-box-containing protein
MASNSDDAERAGGPALDIVLNLVDNLDVLLAYWDSRQVCVFANRAYIEWFGKSRQQAVGLTMEQLLGPALYAKNLPYILGALRDGQTQIFEREIASADGKTRHSLATYTPHIVAGRVVGMYVHVADVTPLKLLQRELESAKSQAEHLATHDFLTGLPNRVLLLDRFQQALALARRKEQMAAVISLDVDDFKGINDAFGHAAGDQLLVETAARLTKTLRASDTVTRLGGDEFLLLAPEIATRLQVEIMAERILDAMWRPFALGPAAVECTVSAGIALFDQDGATADELIANSDSALYAAKQQGKNRYAFYGDAAAPRAED